MVDTSLKSWDTIFYDKLTSWCHIFTLNFPWNPKKINIVTILQLLLESTKVYKCWAKLFLLENMIFQLFKSVSNIIVNVFFMTFRLSMVKLRILVFLPYLGGFENHWFVLCFLNNIFIGQLKRGGASLSPIVNYDFLMFSMGESEAPPLLSWPIKRLMLIHFGCHFLLKSTKLPEMVKISIDKKNIAQITVFQNRSSIVETRENVVLQLIM